MRTIGKSKCNSPNIGKRRKENQESKILIRIARIAVGAAVKWQRKFTDKASKGRNTKEEDIHAKEEARYNTRMPACTRCGTRQETKDMQLKISVGFRATHCKNCGEQERVLLAPISYSQDRPSLPHLKKRRGKKEKRRIRNGKESKTAKFAQASYKCTTSEKRKHKQNQK